VVAKLKATMPYIQDITHLARWLGVSRVQIYRWFKKCPPPDNWFNSFHHKDRKKRKDIYLGYDKIYAQPDYEIEKWFDKLRGKTRIRYKTLSRIRSVFSAV